MIAIIVAASCNGVIGCQGKLPWEGQLPADMDWFKGLTTGNTVIMGRKTWESIPIKFRPLPNRVNIVLSRDATYMAAGAMVAESLVEALEISGLQDVFVIGGASVYADALECADTIYLTEIEASFIGDTHLPPIDWDNWQEVRRDSYLPDERNRYPYSFVTFKRIRGIK